MTVNLTVLPAAADQARRVGWAVRWLDGTDGVSRATYGAATVNVADADWPRSDGVPAEIIVLPFATAVARPLNSPTVATCGLEDIPAP